MPRVQTSIVIKRPPEEVFDHFADGRLLPLWHPLARGEFRLLTGEPIGQGTKFHGRFVG